jgi:hypothetical protein
MDPQYWYRQQKTSIWIHSIGIADRKLVYGPTVLVSLTESWYMDLQYWYGQQKTSIWIYSICMANRGDVWTYSIGMAKRKLNAKVCLP